MTEQEILEDLAHEILSEAQRYAGPGGLQVQKNYMVGQITYQIVQMAVERLDFEETADGREE